MIDFEPLLIMNGDRQWSHPNIEAIANFAYPEWAEPGGEYPLDATIKVFRVYLKGKKHDTYIVFKSEWFEEHLERSMEKYTFTDEEITELLAVIEVTLKEDVWCPGGTQFLETEMYSILNKEHKTIRINFLSADCVLVKDKDEENSYYFDS